MDVQYIRCVTTSVFFKDCNYGQLKHTQDSNEYEVYEATGRKEIDVVVDAGGSDEIIPIGFDMIAIGGAYISVGLVGTQIKIPLFPLIRKECQYLGSLWGNYNELREVMELAKKGLIKKQCAEI
ncbi:hypothetical protein BH18THE2_BH18THE2_32260 [soil metagenome]